jgi:hypothetical protein
MNNWVRALAASGGDLFAGGTFTMADGAPANRIAKWNGGSWTPLGAGVSYWVEALAVSGGELYAGGQFTLAGGAPATYIAKWDGGSWSALGSGMDNTVWALAASAAGELYAGGDFLTAGGKVSAFTAKANLLSIPPRPSLSIQLTAPNVVAVSWPSPSTDFVLQQNTNGLSSVNWSNVTATIQNDGTNKTLEVSPTGQSRFYRLFHP